MLTPAPRIGSLCSGYGGLDMAVQDVLGGSVAWHCQYDPDDRRQYAARILEHHWPNVPNHGDITAVDWAAVEPVDVLTAGFPCQDLSYAGRGAGIKEGTRSGLWYSVADAIGALRPRLVFLENVRAIVDRRPGLDVVLADLARLRFDAEWTCVRASDIGATHERWRWFCLAWPADSDGPRLEGQRLPGATPERSATVADTADLGHERSRSARDGRTGPADRGEAAAHTDHVQHLRQPGEQPRGSAPAGRRDGGVDWGPYRAAIERHERVFGRPAPRPTQPGRSGGEQLSPRFTEWMMGLPAGHVTDVPRPEGMSAPAYRNACITACGNGVVPAQAAYALRILLDRAGRQVAA